MSTPERNAAAEDAVRALLTALGEDVEREGLQDTPKRVAKAFKELLEGNAMDPKEILETSFEGSGYDELVLLRDIPFNSLCEHHLMPFTGVAHVGYLPGSAGRVVGLSKLARVVECFARRLQIQEKMTSDISKCIEVTLGAAGVVVVIEASHSCMSSRGIKKNGATMTTSSMLGTFRRDAGARAEVLSLLRGA